jgi:hypothetical protein
MTPRQSWSNVLGALLLGLIATGEPVRASRQAPFLNRVSDLPTR